MSLSSCFYGEELNYADAQQIETALSACHVQVKDYARDRNLNGRYLIMYHRSEPDHDRKIDCVSDYLQAEGVIATGIYPEPANREGLY